jgi:iron-sulfur cluster repair protein YtfE (RIC family)
VIENLWTHGGHEVEVWEAAPLPDLIIHIVEHYHMEARVFMARLENLAAQAVLLEGGEHPGLLAVRDQIDRFSRDFRAHMTMEERLLFPHLLDPGSGGPVELMPPLVKLLEDEHRAETGLFLRLRSLSEAHLPIAGARNLRVRLGHAFRSMEKSLEGHLYLETQVLFRRVF